MIIANKLYGLKPGTYEIKGTELGTKGFWPFTKTVVNDILLGYIFISKTDKVCTKVMFYERDSSLIGSCYVTPKEVLSVKDCDDIIMDQAGRDTFIAHLSDVLYKAVSYEQSPWSIK